LCVLRVSVLSVLIPLPHLFPCGRSGVAQTLVCAAARRSPVSASAPRFPMPSPGKPYLVGRTADQRLAARFDELVARVTQQRPGSDTELLRRAFEFAAEQHRGQLRQSGEPFLSHPLEVAHLLADMRLDVTALCAALLHDVVEDTKIPIEQIRERFGEEV